MNRRLQGRLDLAFRNSRKTPKCSQEPCSGRCHNSKTSHVLTPIALIAYLGYRRDTGEGKHTYISYWRGLDVARLLHWAMREASKRGRATADSSTLFLYM